MRNAPWPEGAAFLVVKASEGRSAEMRWVLRLSAEALLDGAEREPNDTIGKANPLAITGRRMP